MSLIRHGTLTVTLPRSLRFLAPAAALVVGLTGAGCGGEPGDTAEPTQAQGDEGDAPESIATATLEATVGAEGGTLEGAIDGPFAGFRLVIPAGALAADTQVTVRAVVDPTPLALTAERIGPHFSIEPAGLELAVPAALTVPFDQQLRQAWDTPDTECRVWLRDGEGWSRAEQTASTPEGVTIALPRLTVAGAGVLVAAKSLKCKLTNSCAAAGASGCLAGSTFCLTRLAPPPVSVFDTSSLTIENGFVYFLHSPAANTFTVARYDTLSTTGATTTYVPLAAAPSQPVFSRGRLTPLPSGDVWAGLVGYGNVRFRASAGAARFDTSTTLQPLGAVPLEGASVPVRLTRSASGSTASLKVTTSTTYVASPLSSADIVFARPVRHVAGNEFRLVSGEVAFIGSTSGFGSFDVGQLAKREDSCGSAFTVHLDVNDQQRAVACSDGRLFNDYTKDIAVGVTVGSMVLDDALNTFITDPTRAEITRVSADGGLTTVALTSAAPGTPEHDGMLPRAIRFEPHTGMLLLVTRGNNASGTPDFYLVDKIGG
jgi:hypothetical protein